MENQNQPVKATVSDKVSDLYKNTAEHMASAAVAVLAYEALKFGIGWSYDKIKEMRAKKADEDKGK